jgi:DNA repair protein RecO
MARGVRREKSKLAGGIELFALCDVVISKGKGELGMLTQARTDQFFRHILEDYERLQFAYEVLKLVARASETVDEPEWFDVVAEVLEALDDGTNRQLTEVWFYLRYSALLGYELSLRRDVYGEMLAAEKYYSYDIAEKGLREAANGDIGADHIKFLRLVQDKSLKTVAQIGGIEAILPVCWQVAREHAAI